MNQKIQSLIDGGFISISDIMEYVQQYNELIDQQLRDEYMQMMEEPEYDGAGYTIDDRYESEPIWTEGPQRSVEPLYIVASTSSRPTMHETYIFESDADGNILNLGEYGGIAARFGDVDWGNKDLAVERVMGKGNYKLVRHISTEGMITHSLYVRVYEPEYPLPQDTSDQGYIQEP